MKKVFYSLMIAGVALFATQQATAQETFLNVGIEFALPMGDWSDSFTFGIGASAGAEVGISDNFAVTGTIGYTILMVDDAVEDWIDKAYLVPIQAGGRYYFDQQRTGLFAEAMVGVHIFGITTNDIDLGPFGTLPGGSDSETDFSAAPQLGYFITENISVAAKYQLMFSDPDSQSYLGVKAAFNF